MKKSKPQKSTLPISLSAKKTGVLKHEMLFTPYKIEWKNVQPQSNGQTSSRTFFTSMKNQLSNFKNDIEKMIKKQANKSDNKISKSGVLQDSSSNTQALLISHNKYQSSKQQKNLETGRFQDKNQNCPIIAQSKTIVEQRQCLSSDASQKQAQKNQYRVETLIKQCRLQKNLIIELKKQNHQLYRETEQKSKIQQRLQREFQNENKIRVNQIQALSAEVASLQSNLTQLQNQNLNLRSKNQEVNSKIKRLQNTREVQIQQLRRANDQLRIHNSFLQEKIQSLSQKMGLVTTKFRQKEIYVRQLQGKIQQLKTQCAENYKQQEHQKKQLLDQCLKKVQQNEKQVINKYQQQIKKLKQHYAKKIRQAQMQNQQIIEQLQGQKQRLKTKVKKLQQQLHNHNTQNNQIKEVKESQNNNNKNQKIDFSQLGAQFQRKINELIQQNYGLKNKVTSLEAQIQRLQAFKLSLQNQLKLFQETQAEKNKQVKLSEWQKTLQQIRTLKKQKDQITQQFQFKILKLQNQLQQQRNKKVPQVCQNNINPGITNFNKILKDQLQQNQDLKDKLRESIRQLNSVQRELKQQQQRQAVLNQQLAVQKMKAHLFEKKCQAQQVQPSNFCSNQVINGLKYDLDLLKKKYQALNSMLQSKNKLIKNKDEFIQRVLISKAGKKEEEQEIAYILKQIKFFTPAQN